MGARLARSRNGQKANVAWWSKGSDSIGDDITEVTGAEMVYGSGSQQGVILPQGIFVNVWRHFCSSQLWEAVLLASSE